HHPGWAGAVNARATREPAARRLATRGAGLLGCPKMLLTRRVAGGHDARDDEPAPRGSPHRADSRAVRRRDLRGDRRPDPSQADPRAVQAGARTATAGRLIAGRVRTAALG